MTFVTDIDVPQMMNSNDLGVISHLIYRTIIGLIGYLFIHYFG